MTQQEQSKCDAVVIAYLEFPTYERKTVQHPPGVEAKWPVTIESGAITTVEQARRLAEATFRDLP